MRIFHITSVFFAFVSHCKPCPAASVPPAPGCLPQPATLEPNPPSQVLFSTNYIRTNPFAFILMLFTDSDFNSSSPRACFSPGGEQKAALRRDFHLPQRSLRAEASRHLLCFTPHQHEQGETEPLWSDCSYNTATT